MKRKTLYNFNSVQLTFNRCVFNRIQYRTEHNLYSTRLDNSTDNSTDYSVLTTRLTIRLAIQLYNSAYNSADNSALQFVLSISSDEFVLTNSTYNWPYSFRFSAFDYFFAKPLDEAQFGELLPVTSDPFPSPSVRIQHRSERS